eukprot:365151-Chlamydomonas_euryale.AAC.5
MCPLLTAGRNPIPSHKVHRQAAVRVAGQLHGCCRPAVWVLQASCMAVAGQLHGRCRQAAVRVAGQLHGCCRPAASCMAVAGQLHGCCRPAVWVLQASCMGVAGQLHGCCRPAAWMLQASCVDVAGQLHRCCWPRAPQLLASHAPVRSQHPSRGGRAAACRGPAAAVAAARSVQRRMHFSGIWKARCERTECWNLHLAVVKLPRQRG